MAIAKKPSPKDAQAKKFIHANGSTNGSSTPRRKLRDVIIGFDEALLVRLDSLAQNMGLSRTAFVVNAVAEKVMQLEKA